MTLNITAHFFWQEPLFFIAVNKTSLERDEDANFFRGKLIDCIIRQTRVTSNIA